MSETYQTLDNLPTGFELWWRTQLPKDSNGQRQLGSSILGLSDHFQSNLPTPWDHPTFSKTYNLYFLPLNILRLRHVIGRLIPTGFFEGIDTIVDFGSGPGTGSLSFENTGLVNQILNYEPVEAPKKTHRMFQKKGVLEISNQWLEKEADILPWIKKESCLLLMSYSLNELPKLPEWIYTAKNLLIVEPSTHQKGRPLLELRQKLIDTPSHLVWGPCTHQQQCPLLVHSKKDFCHDRVKPKLPEEWSHSIEKNIPIKNNTLTMSYLATSHRTPPTLDRSRITGDPQKQKGKTLQMVCSDSKRQFLCWMDKNKNYQLIPRGELIENSFSSKPVSHELRVESEITVIDN
tara:strand:+ start:88724 stop:89764 length:1041 start_codon:yes stop_codon:yes gene_type:complete